MYKCFKSANLRLPLIIILSLLLFINIVSCNEEDLDEEKNETEIEDAVIYSTPIAPTNTYLFESFDDESSFEKKWVKSSAKKDDADKNVAKYDGLWALEPLEENSLTGDKGLVLKSKAKHSAISAKLTRPFVFNTKPFIIQYEVNHQNGQECGGAYVKLLTASKPSLDLSRFNDKTPYTIMFGPDKCGNEHKLHFIFRHKNPITKDVEEKHGKRPNEKFDASFKDKKTHLYTLVIKPDSSFEVLLDHQVINSGHLLEDFTPPVNPPKEIDDPKDEKPSDWDDREKIPDPNAVKPVDWDENAPRQIIDLFAEKPEGWLDEESDLIPDPEAVKPSDWDDDMDGEWEAPLVPNPKCVGVAGCGKWKAPMIDNPNYKGKWKAPLLDNPNYKGKWSPRRIHNPDYFEDLEPFKMMTIDGVGLELWSMSDGIYFDNFMVTDNMEEAKHIAEKTFDIKMAKFENFQKSFLTKMIEYSNSHPWIYGVYVLVLAIPVVLIFVCCCAEEKPDDALRKKTDEPEKDDENVEDNNIEDEEQTELTNDADEKSDQENENEEEEEVADEKSESEEVEKSDDDSRKSPRLRKVRKE